MRRRTLPPYKAALKAALSEKTAVVMLTVPNTVGLFETDIKEIADLVHSVGALLYMDGANFNALIGLAKPADFGVDIMHLMFQAMMLTVCLSKTLLLKILKVVVKL